MEQEKQTNRVSRIEEFLLDPEKTIFELLEEFENSVEEIRNALSQVDVANLETLKGEDGKTPERGVDYFTDEDLDNIEAFILDRIPVVGEDVPSPKQVNEYIDKQVAKIPRVKGDKGNPGTPGKPGKNGSPDSALDIIKKLRSLDKNQGLQLNDIRGLSKKIALLNEVSDEFTKLKEDLSNIKILTSGASSDGAVASVNGEVGVVVLTQDDIGNGTTYVQTENNFTDTLLAKLTGLQTSYSFLSLTDTPSDYAGQAGKFVKVNATNDGLEFDSIPGGDMLASVYDPKSVAGNAFDMDNMVEGTNNKLVSSAEKTAWNDKLDDITGESIADLSDVDAIAGITDGKVLKWDTDKFVVADDDDTTYTASDFDIKDLTDSNNLRTTWSGKQDALGFTPEDVVNKSTNIITDAASNTKYPGVKAIKDYADGLVAGLLDYRGGYDASSGDYPITGGSGTAGAVMKGDMWVISVAGTIGGEDIQVGDSIIANIDTPGQTASNWNHLNANISYVPEDVANKKTAMTGNTTSDTFYLTAKAIYDWATGLFQTLSNIVTSFQATPDDSHYPSEKLVKESLDAKANANNVLALDNTTAFTPDNDYEPATKKYVDSGTKTLTNTRITPRITTITSHATPTINTDNCDAVTITAQAEAITSMTTNLSGTPTNFQKLIIRIKDNGTARAITWGASFEAKGVALPTTTVISKVLTVGFIYDTVTSKWGCVASSQEA